jgi:PAS domain S-box-containing protein
VITRLVAVLVGLLGAAAVAAHVVGFVATGASAERAVYTGWCLAALAMTAATALAARRVPARRVALAWMLWSAAGALLFGAALYRFFDGSSPSPGGLLVRVAAVVMIGGVAARTPHLRAFWLLTLDAFPAVLATVVALTVWRPSLQLDALGEAAVVANGTLFLFLAIVNLQVVTLRARPKPYVGVALFGGGFVVLACASLAWTPAAAESGRAAGHAVDPLWSVGMLMLATYALRRASQPASFTRFGAPSRGSAPRTLASAFALAALFALRAAAPDGATYLLDVAGILGVTALAARLLLERWDTSRALARLERERGLVAEAEGRYRTLVEETPLVSYINGDDASVPVEYVSPQIEPMLGFPVEQIVGDPEFFPRCLHPGDRERVLAEHERAFATGEPLATEYRVVARDGRIVWFRDEGRVVIAPDGGRKLHGFLLDVSEQRRAEDALRDAEERYRNLVERLPVVTYTAAIDPTVPATYMSPQMETLTGYTAEECMTDPDMLERLLHPDDRDRMMAAHHHTLETGEPLRAEYRVVGKDGRVAWVLDEAVVVTDADGEPAYLQGAMLDVTARRAAEAALRETEDRFRTMADSAPVLIWMCHGDGAPAFFNQGWLAFVGRTLEEELALTFEGVHPDDVEDTHRVFDDAVAGQSGYETEYRLLRHDGQWRWVVERAAPRFLSDGTFAGLTGVTVDITERRQAEEERLISEERFRGSFAASSIGMALVAPSGEWLQVNPALCTILGYDEDELLATTFQNITHPDDLDGDLDLVAQALEGTVPHYTLEKRYLHKDGHVVWALLSVSLVRDGSGSPLHFVSQIQDITERKRVEHALVETSETLRQLIANSPLPVVAFDRDGRVTLWNPAAEETFGWSEEEAVGNLHRLVPPHDEAAFARALELNRKGRSWRNVEVQRLHKDGTLIEVSASSAPIRDADGEVVGMVSVLADVTKRKRAQEALRASEERFRTTFENAAIGMAVTNRDGAFLMVNHAMCSIVGYTEEELLATTFAAITHPDDLVANLVPLREMYEGKRDTFSFEKRYVHKDGHPVWVRIDSAIVRPGDGETPVAITQIQDITEGREAAEQLARAEERYRTLVEQLPLAIYVDKLDEHSSAIYMSPQIEAILGYSVEEWLADPLLLERILHPDDRERVMAEVRGMLDRSEPLMSEYRLIAKDGRTVWIRDADVAIRDEDGQPLYAQGYMLDVTEQKATEERLREAEENFRTLVEQLPAVVYTCEPGPDGRWLYVSPRVEAVLGLSPDEWLSGRPLSTHMHPEDRERVNREEDEDLARGDSVFSEYRFVRPDGRTVWLQDQAAVVRDAAGEPRHLRGFMLDVTEGKLAQEALVAARAELQEQNERLRELDRLKDEFVALVSHELRTPLTSIHGYLDLVLEGEAGELTDDQERFLGVVNRNAVRLQRLVGDLLFVAQVEAGRLQLHEGPVDLPALAAECVEAASPVAAEKGVRLECTSAELPTFTADRSRLGQLLDNLVSNAIKFTPEGGLVQVRVAAGSGSAVIEVADSGMGIPEEEQQHLFQRFFRTEDATRQAIQGTGLGLAITKAIAEGHGGHVSVESTPGAGTTFRVEIPLRGAAEQEPAEAA